LAEAAIATPLETSAPLVASLVDRRKGDDRNRLEQCQGLISGSTAPLPSWIPRQTLDQKSENWELTGTVSRPHNLSLTSNVSKLTAAKQAPVHILSVLR